MTRWNQLRQLEALQHGLGTLFSRPPALGPEGHQESLAVAAWSPREDISEDDTEYLIKVELPEVRKQDVKVTAEAGTLTIMGERKFEKEEKGRKFHKVERSYGKFIRQFALPAEVDAPKIQAEFKDGMLNVHLPKTAIATPKAIEVKVH